MLGGSILSILGFVITVIGILVFSPCIDVGVAFMFIGVPILIASAVMGLTKR